MALRATSGLTPPEGEAAGSGAAFATVKTMRTRIDDLGASVTLPARPERIVSLVPSLTEALAISTPDRLVGATQWCTHPPDLDVARVRGTKNPDLAAITDLQPDLVVANREENRELDVRRLRERGIAVWVTEIETVPQALTAMGRLFTDALAAERPAWLERATRLWLPEEDDQHPALDAPRVAVAIWREPWMVVGPRTYTQDLLHRLGWRGAFADHPDRYPQVDLAAIDRSEIDLVLLPDEPYEFTAADGPEAFSRTATELVSGRLLTWYGPAMVEAHARLPRP